MAVDISAETVIRAPREQVASFAADPANDPAWIGGVETAEIVEGDGVGVGTKVRRRAKFLGKSIVYVNEIVELQPGVVLRMRSVEGPFPMRIDYAWADEQGGTRMSIRVRGDSSGFFSLGGPIMGAAVKRNVSGDLKRLQAVLEGRGSVAPPGMG
jgi:Polyketide cyclase / dehydrase and lipid transport